MSFPSHRRALMLATYVICWVYSYVDDVRITSPSVPALQQLLDIWGHVGDVYMMSWLMQTDTVHGKRSQGQLLSLR